MIGEVHPRHRSEDFRHFLDTVDVNRPRELDLHLILDSAATPKTALIQRWVLRHPRVHLHFTPASASWLNLVECWFSLLQRRALARAACASTDALEAALRADVAATSAAPTPFVWTKIADEFLPRSSAPVSDPRGQIISHVWHLIVTARLAQLMDARDGHTPIDSPAGGTDG